MSIFDGMIMELLHFEKLDMALGTAHKEHLKYLNKGIIYEGIFSIFQRVTNNNATHSWIQ